jgi:glycosyltransferase involved in cell wall biosynthesis
VSCLRRRSRILFVHHRGEPSGASRALALLVDHLDPERFEAELYLPRGPAGAAFEQHGLRVHRGPVAGLTHVWASRYRGARWLVAAAEAARLVPHVLALRRLLRRGGFDVVHLNDSPLVAAAFLAHRAGVPVVWHLRSALAHEGRLRRRLLQAALRRLADAPIAINCDVAESFGIDAEVVHDSVDLTRFDALPDAAAARASLGLPHDRAVVAFLGYLYPLKGFRELLEAAGILRARGVAATVILAGGAVRSSAYLRSWRGRALRALRLTADYEAEALSRVERDGLAGHVRLLPRLDDPGVLYAAADVVVHPSRGPEVGLPAIEAAAAGLPAIITGSSAGAGVVLADETGRVLPDARPAVLAEAIIDLLERPAERARLGRAARAHARATFDPRANAAKVEAVYERLTARALSPPNAARSSIKSCTSRAYTDDARNPSALKRPRTRTR